MEIILTDEEVRRINEAGELTGLERREIVKRALASYLNNLREMPNLENETQTWDGLSDEDLENLFEEAKEIKPKLNLTAEDMDRITENEISR